MNSSFYILGALDLIAVLIGCLIFPPAKNKWVQQALMVADNEAVSEEFGRAIAIKGNTAAIAAPCDSVPKLGEPMKRNLKVPNQTTTSVIRWRLTVIRSLLAVEIEVVHRHMCLCVPLRVVGCSKLN